MTRQERRRIERSSKKTREKIKRNPARARHLMKRTQTLIAEARARARSEGRTLTEAEREKHRELMKNAQELITMAEESAAEVAEYERGERPL